MTVGWRDASRRSTASRSARSQSSRVTGITWPRAGRALLSSRPNWPAAPNSRMRGCGSVTESVAIVCGNPVPVAAGDNMGHPVRVGKVPVDGFGQAAGKGFHRGPTQLPLDLAGVDGVAAVVAGAVLDGCDQVAVAADSRWLLRGFCFQQVTEGFDHVDIGHF